MAVLGQGSSSNCQLRRRILFTLLLLLGQNRVWSVETIFKLVGAGPGNFLAPSSLPEAEHSQNSTWPHIKQEVFHQRQEQLLRISLPESLEKLEDQVSH